jgi:acetoacetate decarboxylase
MLKGYTLPRTPRGTSSLAPTPPWNYVCTCLTVEFAADPAKAAAFLPEGLEPGSGNCTAFFAEWQSSTDSGQEYLDPQLGQYHEAFILISAKYEGAPAQFCPFIWVSQDVSMMRGLVMGLPKQIGSIWLTRAYNLKSPATPVVGPGGQFGATLAVKDRRLLEARVTLKELSDAPPPLGNMINLRYFPQFIAGQYEVPAVHELVKVKPRNIQASAIWKGDASLTVFDHPYIELADLRPLRVMAGSRFEFGFTLDDSVLLRDLRAGK